MSRFTQRPLDPASRAGEILFGLIMVLAATLTFNWLDPGSREATFVFGVNFEF
jgi:hypothetical protein